MKGLGGGGNTGFFISIIFDLLRTLGGFSIMRPPLPYTVTTKADGITT